MIETDQQTEKSRVKNFEASTDKQVIWEGSKKTAMDSRIDRIKLDGFYSWIVCFAVFLAEFIVMGFYTSFGTVFIALIMEFKASESLAGTNLNFLFDRYVQFFEQNFCFV